MSPDLTALAALILSLVGFVVTLRLMRAEEAGSGVLVTAREAGATLSARDLSDDEKEARIRAFAGRLFLGFLRIGAIALVSVGVAAAVVWGGSALGLYTLGQAMEIGAGWPFLVGSTIGAVALWMLLRRRAQPSAGTAAPAGTSDADETAPTDALPYSATDRALHRVAFGAPGLQRMLAGMEAKRYADRIDPATAARPVFVTSLARAGTTILLEVLARQPEFATATYRHMPFPLAPLLWSDLTGRHRREGVAAERAHGDGIELSYDSPEAFEEMAWMAFWKEHYRPDRILPWEADARNPEFEEFFRLYRARVVATRDGARRYVSKNNASIARLGLLERLCPDARIVIPVRDPFAHAQSLLRQHRRFTALQEREPFARRYMEGIGHFEFGAALRPIAFGGEIPDPAEAGTEAFWLDYWARAYETVRAAAGPRTVLVDHDALSADPRPRLARLGAALDLADPDALIARAADFRPPRPVTPDPALPEALVTRVRALHADLVARAL